MNKRAATAIRMRPETAMPKYCFKTDAVKGQAATPDNSANQPFVSGHCPFVQSSTKPPPPATIVQAHAAIQPSIAAALFEIGLF
jgi:hypothetical protein